MKRTLPILIAAAALALPASASARVLELGSNAAPVTTSCPTSCTAPGKVSGYQTRAGKVRNPFIIPARGKIVAYTVQLGDPAPDQISYFQNLYGERASLRLGVFRRGKRKKTKNDYRLLRQSPVQNVDGYFGSAPTFALDKPLPVTKGYVIGLNIPTWAPVFAVGQEKSSAWLASRTKRRCTNVQRNALADKIDEVYLFQCSYASVRLTYTVTYVPDPRPTKKVAN